MEYPIKQLALESFPPLLKEINDPPSTLFLRGTLPPQDSHYLGVVGSRDYSPYGKRVCETLIKGLKGYPITIVSGLALGIDAIAHRAALSAQLHTLAIPGSGLGWNVLYPKSNHVLAKEILKAGGALLSEFEEDFKATKYSFPKRNRLMAGISHALLVIEAKDRSGTLITARLATEYNRDVLAVPHSIFSPTAYGPHMLIRLGAVPITRVEDILEIFALDKELTSHTMLSKKESLVVGLLDAPRPREEIIAHLDMPPRDAQQLLTAMELKGIITEKEGMLCLV
jgi:DNA processing protein